MAASHRDPLAAAVILDVPPQLDVPSQPQVIDARIALPEGVRPYRIDWVNSITIGTLVRAGNPAGR